MNINHRLAKLEAKQQAQQPQKIVVIYADQTDPEKLEALRARDDITLIVVEYAGRIVEDEQP